MRDEPVLLTSEQVANRLAISLRTLWRYVKFGTVPPPLRYSRKLVRWNRCELERWLGRAAEAAPPPPAPPATPPGLIKLRTAARRLGVSSSTASRLVKRGTLPAWRLLGRGGLMVRADDVERLMTPVAYAALPEDDPPPAA
jgi:excisionase family DNA binding protein